MPPSRIECVLCHVPCISATKGFDFCNGKDDNEDVMTLDDAEAAFMEEVKHICKKWRKRFENRVNKNGCTEASV